MPVTVFGHLVTQPVFGRRPRIDRPESRPLIPDRFLLNASTRRRVCDLAIDVAHPEVEIATMKIPFESVIDLLHGAGVATLATHSAQMAGYPYATALPCVVDEAHCPLFCISALAEHTKNLLADGRASLSVVRAEVGNVLTAERMTLVGDAERVDAHPELVARYLRYEPEAEQYLQLDFMFFRFTPRRVRYIGGLGRMGWLDADAWAALPVLPLREEAELLHRFAARAPAGVRLSGIDFFGVDYVVEGTRSRHAFPVAAERENLAAAVDAALAALGSSES